MPSEISLTRRLRTVTEDGTGPDALTKRTSEPSPFKLLLVLIHFSAASTATIVVTYKKSGGRTDYDTEMENYTMTGGQHYSFWPDEETLLGQDEEGMDQIEVAITGMAAGEKAYLSIILERVG